ncbi:MAG: phosphate acetyltransferase, partial [Treponema sp.]
ERTLRAARALADMQIAAAVFLVGNTAEVEGACKKLGVPIGGFTIIDPDHSEWTEDFAQALYEKRKAKGLTLEQAKKDIMDPLRFAAMMLVKEKADAMVAGAENTTANVLRAGLTIVGVKEGVKNASSCFIVDTKSTEWGTNGMLIFADSAVIPTPTTEQLADIATAAAESCRAFIETEPVVALLSFSTKGSGGDKDENILRVRNAVKLLDERKVDFCYDGEMQLDAALIPEVTDRKAPGSPIRDKVNTLIFPDLGSANIGYKLVQRFAKAEAYGPFMQGFAKPLSDLSRGCSTDDIIVTSIVTLVQAGKK